MWTLCLVISATAALGKTVTDCLMLSTEQSIERLVWAYNQSAIEEFNRAIDDGRNFDALKNYYALDNTVDNGILWSSGRTVKDTILFDLSVYGAKLAQVALDPNERKSKRTIKQQVKCLHGQLTSSKNDVDEDIYRMVKHLQASASWVPWYTYAPSFPKPITTKHKCVHLWKTGFHQRDWSWATNATAMHEFYRHVDRMEYFAALKEYFYLEYEANDRFRESLVRGKLLNSFASMSKTIQGRRQLRTMLCVMESGTDYDIALHEMMVRYARHQVI